MKETIYTIPVNEAYNTDCECPMCILEKNLEKEAVEYSLGPAMMEPDFREQSNKIGFCLKHFEMMFSSPSKLPLALVLDTHVENVISKLSEIEKKSHSNETKGLFKKNKTTDRCTELSNFLSMLDNDCMVCKKTNHTMERYADVLCDMWVCNEEFKAKFEKSKGVCLKHLKLLSNTAASSLKEKDKNAFITALLKKELCELDRINSDIHKFTLKFDYRNRDMDLGTAKDAPQRTIEKLSGYMNK